MNNNITATDLINEGKGILRLAPTWVPRYFCTPGRRIKLHPDDYFSYGGERGGIDERWLSSTTKADNGPLTSKNEGLSYCVSKNGEVKLLLKHLIEELKSEIIGERLWSQFKCWPVYSKFFDNQDALPFHIHQQDGHAKLTGQLGKPESYYFPPQLNNHSGNFPFTFFGIIPGTTKSEVIKCLKNFNSGDNKITNISVAYRLEPGTGWDVPSGVLHAPGSLCTYEPQKASDVFAMYESVSGNMMLPLELLWKDSPQNQNGNFDYLIEQIDWKTNLDANFKTNRFMIPKPVRPFEEMEKSGYQENWISYKSTDFSAKELTVFPGRTVVVKDNAAYGLIVMQGHGKINDWELETPVLIRFGQLTNDEFFVSEQSATEGVRITNNSSNDNLVMLKLFGPENPELVIN